MHPLHPFSIFLIGGKDTKLARIRLEVDVSEIAETRLPVMIALAKSELRSTRYRQVLGTPR